MATNFLETAKNLKAEMQSLLHELGATKATIGELLDQARRTEGSMIDREEKEKQEREERERAERLRTLLESDQDLAAHDIDQCTLEILEYTISDLTEKWRRIDKDTLGAYDYYRNKRRQNGK